MTSKNKFLASLLVFISSWASANSNLCINYINNYKKNSLDNFYYKKARVEHLLDLISKSKNKYKLINDLYLHYYSLEESDSNLSKSLELCLIDLLYLDKNIPKNKTRELISSFVVNNKFLSINQNALACLKELSKKEQSFFNYKNITKNNFDEAILLDIGLMANPDFAQVLERAYNNIIEVCYEGHNLFFNSYIKLVSNFLSLIKNTRGHQTLRILLKIYAINPTVENFHAIKAQTRNIYSKFIGERLPLSPSELWGQLWTVTEEIRLELCPDELFADEIIYMKNIFDSNKLSSVKAAAGSIIMLLKSCAKDAYDSQGVQERIEGIF